MRTLCQWIVLGVACALLGCSSHPPEPPPVPVLKGKLTKGGQPLAVSQGMGDYAHVAAIFIPLGHQATQFNCKVAADGTFTAASSDGSVPAPGKYRVAVRQWDPFPRTDKLNGAFDEDRSPIVVEITNPPTDLVIDLDKPRG